MFPELLFQLVTDGTNIMKEEELTLHPHQSWPNQILCTSSFGSSCRSEISSQAPTLSSFCKVRSCAAIVGLTHHLQLPVGVQLLEPCTNEDQSYHLIEEKVPATTMKRGLLVPELCS